MAEREVRYCKTSDRVRISYSVQGHGPILLMTPMLFMESFLLEDLSPGYREFSRRLSESCQLIQYDTRGVGSSSKNHSRLDFESLMLDLEAVVEAVDHESIAVFGRAMGSTVAIEFAACHAGKVSRLALYAPVTTSQSLMSREEMTGLAQMCRANWEMASRVIADVSSRTEFGDKALLNAEWYKQSTSGEHVAQLYEVAADADFSSRLEEITCPTVVLQPMNDGRWKAETGQDIAAAIDGASFVPLKGGLHHFALGDPEPLLATVLDFIGAETTHRAGSPQAFRTVLFTDLVGHTEMMSRLGDERGRDVLRGHEQITRDVLKDHAGSEIKTMGDGFMASFGSVTRAMDCAIALQRAFAEHNSGSSEPLQVRVGLNAGEPIEEDGDLFGSTVIMASRIAAKAGAGEILIPEPLRHLLTGKSYVYADRGETMLKGFEDAVRLFEVRWREDEPA